MKRILAVDDDQDILQLLGAYLKGKYQLATVKSGNEALDYLSNNELPDLILLDVEMPTMNGIELKKKLDADQKFKKIPVIFLTAHTHHADRVDPHLGFLNKPIIKEDLLIVIDTFINLPFQKV